MRLLSWNINHRTRAKLISPALTAGIDSLKPDVVILTEYVHSPERNGFLADLVKAGLGHYLVSECVPGQNHVLVASRTPLAAGPIRASDEIAKLAQSVPSNTLHAQFPSLGIDVLGLRLPDYSKQPRIKRACWEWILKIAAEAKDRPFIILGDFNTDSNYSKSRCGDRISILVENGWQHAQPAEGASYWTINGQPVRIDHAFVSRHFTIQESRYVTEFAGTSFIGTKNDKLSDHAALVIDIDWKSSSFPNDAENK